MCPPGCGQRGPWRPLRISSLAETSREPQVAVMTAKHRGVPRDRVAGAPRATPSLARTTPVACLKAGPVSR